LASKEQFSQFKYQYPNEVPAGELKKKRRMVHMDMLVFKGLSVPYNAY
jgi:hypothetical protein